MKWLVDDGKIKKNRSSLLSSSPPSSSSSDYNPTFLLLHYFLILCIQRQAAFSSILLSEAIHLLPLSAAVLLLRMLSHLLNSFYHSKDINNEGVDNSEYNYDGDYNVEQKSYNNNSNSISSSLNHHNISRIITWIEAVIDGHFSSIALHVIDNKAQTRHTLIKLMKIINCNEENNLEIQELLGLWIQMNRVIYHHGQQTKPMDTLYQVEKLSLF
jgi:DNA-directed RNA polymerase